MTDRVHRCEELAQEFREEEHLEDAGNYYTAAGYGRLCQNWPIPEDVGSMDLPDGTSPRSVGLGIQYLLAGALCYRLSDNLDRCENRCEQGTLFIKDILESDPIWQEKNSMARCGLGYEMIGDLRLYGDLGGYGDAYETAEDYYLRATPEQGWQGETEFTAIMSILIEFTNSVDFELSSEKEAQIRDLSLVERIQYKQENYHAIIESVISDGNWTSDVI
jgi:hypothetical protein